MNINSDLNAAREAISMVDDMSFICRHIVSSVICEIDGKGQTILDYTTTQEASNFSIFQESVMLEYYDDDWLHGPRKRNVITPERIDIKETRIENLKFNNCISSYILTVDPEVN